MKKEFLANLRQLILKTVKYTCFEKEEFVAFRIFV